MSDSHCACPSCHCRVESKDWMHDGKAYCCQACYEGHPPGMTQCQSTGCTCGEEMARDHQGDVG